MDLLNVISSERSVTLTRFGGTNAEQPFPHHVVFLYHISQMLFIPHACFAFSSSAHSELTAGLCVNYEKALKSRNTQTPFSLPPPHLSLLKGTALKTTSNCRWLMYWYFTCHHGAASHPEGLHVTLCVTITLKWQAPTWGCFLNCDSLTTEDLVPQLVTAPPAQTVGTGVSN